ncbi:MAG: Processing peptidase [Candidatus Uhrbacteria bacterium GW2011_GWA2_41_10]|nr:MAG: Processing peptidase [Candidatus Uhrbacteria bacterium GW2011_GWA2_41_10]
MSSFLTLKNGLRTHLIPFEGPDAATLLVLCKVGSRYEDAPINGASHFIEHLMFKGTKRRPTTLDISRALDSVGAEYNAYTGKDLTGYYVKVDSHHLKLAVDVLHDMLFHSKFDKKELDRERGVIIEEINMYQDNPIMYSEELMEQAMFDGNTLGWQIAGSPETMRAMSRADILRYRDSHYIPSRMVIAAAGKIPEEIEGWLDGTFGTVKETQTEPKEFSPFGVLPTRRTPRIRIQHKETQQIQLAIGFPSYGLHDKRDAAARILGIILGGTMSSRLFVSIRERRGLAYMIRASQSPYEDIGNFTIQAGLEKARLDLALKTIMDELRLVKKRGVKPEELKLAKNYVHGKLMLHLEDSSDRAEYYARQELFRRKVETPEMYVKRLQRVNVQEVQQAAQDILDYERLCLGVIGPYKTPAIFLKHLPSNIL